jgi:limonene-1,2-epoxide hydrolase
MTTSEIAKDFVNMLKNNDSEAAAEKYNADDIVSYEAMEGPMAVCHGKEAVNKKSAWWYSAHEVNRLEVGGPYVNGDSFVVRFTLDVTVKETGENRAMDEVGVYKVKDGKIVEERFFYGTMS